jgi:hypothetical protein
MVGSGGSDKAAPAPVPAVIATAPGLAMPPEGMHPDAGRSNPALPTPPGGTADQAALGNGFFMARRATACAVNVTGRMPAARAQFRPLAVE